jgi:hypothetical protein
MLIVFELVLQRNVKMRVNTVVPYFQLLLFENRNKIQVHSRINYSEARIGP